MPIGEVSYLLGFAEPSNFTRAFKRWTGQSPSEFRSRGVSPGNPLAGFEVSLRPVQRFFARTFRRYLPFQTETAAWFPPFVIDPLPHGMDATEDASS